MDYEFDHSVPSGGGAARRGGCFHLSFRSGSRGGGASARGGVRLRHAQRRVRRSRSRSRPSTPSPITCRRGPRTIRREYWDAADLYERANGRLYVSADFALPRDLDRRGSDRAGA